jgi:hypothetical protein
MGTKGRGYLVWTIGGAIFAVPEIWASRDSTLPFPTLSGTIGHLERRWEIVSLLVIIVIANALLHAVRLGFAAAAQLAEARAVEAAGETPAAPSPTSTVPLRGGRYLALAQGRVTRTRTPKVVSDWTWYLYAAVALGLIATGFLLPLAVHHGHSSPAERQLAGEFGYGAMALTFFLIPTLVAWRPGVLLPYPGLFQTVVNLEARLPIVAVVVAGCMTFLMLHLVFYPYPSIIPWFPNLENLHNYCLVHPHAQVCLPNK